jgi:TonB family protein
MLLAVMLLQAAGPGRPPPSTADLPPWSKTPSQAEMAAAYPAEAKKANLAGSAVVECSVQADGLLANCAVVNETPAGAGFGGAAMALAGKFQMPAKSPSGAAMAGRTVQFPLRWLNNPNAKADPIIVFDDAGGNGQVVFNCRVRADRGVDNCVVVDAMPRGSNLFGKAGEAVMRQKAPPKAGPGDRLLLTVEVKAQAQ